MAIQKISHPMITSLTHESSRHSWLDWAVSFFLHLAIPVLIKSWNARYHSEPLTSWGSCANEAKDKLMVRAPTPKIQIQVNTEPFPCPSRTLLFYAASQRCLGRDRELPFTLRARRGTRLHADDFFPPAWLVVKFQYSSSRILWQSDTVTNHFFVTV